MDIKKIIESRTYLIIALSFAFIAVAVLVFGAGMFAGYRKARFSYEWGKNYHQNFGDPRQGFPMMDFGGKDLINANGVDGQIIKINIPANVDQPTTIVVKGRDNTEKIVVVKKDATIRSFRENIKLSDLKVDDFLVAIGEPNSSGQIEAKFLRIMPPAASSSMTQLKRMPF